MGHYRDSLLQRIAEINNKIQALPSESPLKGAWHDVVMDKTRSAVKASSEDGLSSLKLPPLFGLLDGLSEDAIKALNEDLAIVGESSDGLDPLTDVSRKTPMEDRKWCGALFEVYAKSVCLKRLPGTSTDCELPNKKTVDIYTTLDGMQSFIECTVMTDSDEDRVVFDRFMEQRSQDPDAVLIRPGPLDAAGSRGPSPYYDMLRMYAKVYDKLAPGLDVERSQTSVDRPNILFLSFSTARSPIRHDSPGVGWALDELFVAQPRGSIPLHDSPGVISGVSLQDWLDFTSIEERRMDSRTYADNFGSLIEAPRRLGAIAMFNGCKFAGCRVNYNANEENRVTHRQIVLIESLFADEPPWARQ